MNEDPPARQRGAVVPGLRSEEPPRQPEGRGDDWTEERQARNERRSDEGRSRLQEAPEASGGQSTGEAATREGAASEGGMGGRAGPRRQAGEHERLVSPLAEADERVIESTLRPKRLNDFIGQARVREQLSIVLEGAQRRAKPPDHVLLS